MIFIQIAKHRANHFFKHLAIVMIVNIHSQVLWGQLIKELLRPQALVQVLTIFLMLINFGELLLVTGSVILVVELILDNHL